MVRFAGVVATTFNVISDFTSVLIHVLFGLMASIVYSAVMKVHFKHGKSVPIR